MSIFKNYIWSASTVLMRKVSKFVSELKWVEVCLWSKATILTAVNESEILQKYFVNIIFRAFYNFECNASIIE